MLSATPDRSLMIGLLGACILLLARLESTVTEVTTRGATLAMHAPPPGATSATIVDVAPGVRAADVPSLIRLGPGERVARRRRSAVDSDLAAGVAIANRAPSSGTFVDLEIEGAGGSLRRVLVLMHGDQEVCYRR